MTDARSPAIVHIIDDDQAIRDALAWLFKTRKVPTQQWDSGESFLQAWHPELNGCLLLDIRMEGLSGLEVFDQLCEKGATQPVIFLTGHGDLPMAVASLKRGAVDFIEKPFNDNELVDRVLEVLHTYQLNREEQLRQQQWNDKLASLSSREKQVLQLALQGMLNKQIAEMLDVSMRTIEVHRARILEKTGTKNLLELARFCGSESFLIEDNLES
ncbi:MAG: response regulator transcription factor [Paenalcaligenes sp.]